MKRLFLLLATVAALCCPRMGLAQNAASLPVLATCGTATYAAGNLGYMTLLPGGNLCISGALTLSGTASNAGSGVGTTSTNLPTVSYNYGFNGTTWDQLQVDASKNLKTSATVTPGTVTLTQTVVTFTAATSRTLIAANASRKYLFYMNVGTNPVTLAPGVVTVTAGAGVNLDPGSTSANQGGWFAMESSAISQQAFSGISTAGTTVVIWEGQ